MTLTQPWQESGGGADPFSLAVYNGSLYWFGQYGDLHINAVNLACLQSDATLPTNQATLQKAATVKEFGVIGHPPAMHSQSPAGSALAVTGGKICCFSNDDRQGIVATASTDPTNDSQSWYRLLDANGNALAQLFNGRQSDVAATVIDDDTMLVAALGGAAANSPVVNIGVYRISALPDDPQNTSLQNWTASEFYALPVATVLTASFSSNIATLSPSLHLEWYCQNPQTFWLGISLAGQPAKNSNFNNQNTCSAYLCWIPLDIISSPLIYIGQTPTGENLSSVAFEITNLYAPVSLKRDPGGSVRIYGAQVTGSGNGTPNLYISTQPANAAPQNPATLATLQALSLNNAGVADPPVGVFLYGNNDIATPVSINKVTTTQNASPVAEAVFLLDTNENLWCTSAAYGRTLPWVQNAVANTTQGGDGILTLSGIFDAPFPVHNANIASYQGGPLAGASLGEVIYGTTDQTSTNRSVNVDVSVGFQASESFTKGVGPAFSIAMSAGVGTDTGSGTQVIQVNDASMSTNVNQAGTAVQTLSAMFGSAMEFSSLAYLFVQPGSGGVYSLASSGATTGQIWSRQIGSVRLDFSPYTVTPGEITSYTRQAINQKMAGLGYPGGDYFGDVVEANGYVNPQTGKSYEEIPVSFTGSNLPAVELTDTSFTEFSWDFNASVYAGLSGGGGVDFFGVGEEAQWSAMAGFTLDVNSSENAETDSTWGISFDSVFCPQGRVQTGAPPIVQSYTARVYFLPASRKWTKEAQAFGGTLPFQLDPNSAPWRMAFEVAYYLMSDGTTYPPKGQFATPGVPAITGWQQFPSGLPASLSVWQAGQQVTYAIGFLYNWEPQQLTMGPASSPVATPPSSGCPLLTLPSIPTGTVPPIARLLYRTIGNGPTLLVKTILDNTLTTCSDDDPQFNFIPPQLTVGPFTARSNVPYIAAWTPGNLVSYTMTFTFASGAASNIWQLESMSGTPVKALAVGAFAQPQLLNIPVFPSGGSLPVCTGRNIYRTTYAADGSTLIEDHVLVINIPNNNPIDFVVDNGPQLLGTPSARAVGVS